MKRLSFALSLLVLPVSSAYADFTCSTTASGYKNCVYQGTIEQIYMNKNGLVLISPTTPLNNLSDATDIGFAGVTQEKSIAVGYVFKSDTSDSAQQSVAFTKGILALATSAKLSGKMVTMAFTDIGDGATAYKLGSYLALDRMTLR